MRAQVQRLGARFAQGSKSLLNAMTGRIAVPVLKLARRLDPDRAADRAGRFMQRLGPHLPEHGVGRANLAAAYPEKSEEDLARLARIRDQRTPALIFAAHLANWEMPALAAAALGLHAAVVYRAPS